MGHEGSRQRKGRWPSRFGVLARGVFTMRSKVVAVTTATLALTVLVLPFQSASATVRSSGSPHTLTQARFASNRARLAMAGPRIAGGDPGGLSAATIASTPVGAGPGLEALDVATDTIYVADSENFSGGDTISVINGAACRAGDISGCMRSSPTVTVGNDPLDVAVDEATDTVYVANGNDNTVSVIDGATCNSQVHSAAVRPLRWSRSAPTRRRSPLTTPPTRPMWPTGRTTRCR